MNVYHMEQRKIKFIMRQKVMFKVFWITLFFLIGFICGLQPDNSDFKRIIFQMSILLLAIVLILIIYTFIKIGKGKNPMSSNLIESIEKLGKLKNQGFITEEEFIIEKKKILDKE